MAPQTEQQNDMKNPNLNKKVKVTLPKVKLMKSEKHFSLNQLLVFIVIFGAIGGYILYHSFALGPLVASMEAEQLSLPSGGTVVADSTASTGKAIKLTTPGNASGSINFPSSVYSLTVTARGDQCSGAPTMSMSVDNAVVLSSTAVSSSSWASYTFTPANAWSSGAHSLAVSFTNPASYNTYKGNSGKIKGNCTRALYIDVTNFYGPEPAPTPAPTVSISASPTSVTAGQSSTISWNSTNSTSCTASGSWSGTTGLSGNTSTGPINTVSTYTLTCTGAGGSATSSVTITVNTSTTSSGCVLNDNSPCPASYFNGPLGTNNLIPSKPGEFLLDQYGAIGCVWNTCSIPGIQARQTAIGRHFDGIGVQINYGDASNNCTLRDPSQSGAEQWIHNNGSFPIIRWNPNATIGQINSGYYDTCFRNLANYFHNFNFTIMFSPLTEFDAAGNIWQAEPSAANGNVNYCGGPFISAWQRMVNIMHPLAPNLGFVWEPEEGYHRDCVNISYPGDTYVDWSSSDWYNTCMVGNTSQWCSPLHSGWAQFGEVFNYTAMGSSAQSQHDLWGPHKPFVIMETGSWYDSNYPTYKGQWFRNAVSDMKKMKYLRGTMWFDVDVTAAEGPLNNFKVDYVTSNSDVYNGFVQMSKDPWFAAK